MNRAALGLIASLAVAACSTDVDDLFGGDGNGEGGTGGVSSTSSSPTGSTVTSGPASSGQTTTGDSTTQTTSSSVASTAQATTAVSTGMDPDPTVDCGGAGACSVANGAICCWTDEDELGECQPDGSACTPGSFDVMTAVSCQLPSQCPGQVCCAHRLYPSNQSEYEWTACVNECADPDRILCDPNAPDCGAGQSCVPSTLLPPGFHVCSNT
jgi:hypothetical protein